MNRNLFIRRFDRGLPRLIGYALIALAALAVIDHYKGSLMAKAEASFTPAVDVRWPSPEGNDDGSGIPRECDLPAGIATDCLFLD